MVGHMPGAWLALCGVFGWRLVGACGRLVGARLVPGWQVVGAWSAPGWRLVGACLALAFGAGGSDGSGGMLIWPLFGTTNQLLAGLTLLVISVMLVKLRRRFIFTLVPMMFVTLMSFLAAIYQLWDLFTTGSYLLMTVAIVVIILAILVMLESSSAFTRERRAAAGAG